MTLHSSCGEACHRGISDVKTKYSNAGIPLDPALADVLLNWRRKTRFKKSRGLVFASPFVAGKLPWYPWGVERCHIIPQAFVAVLDVWAGIRSATQFRLCLMKPGLR